MLNSNFPYTSVEHFRKETQLQIKFLKDIPLNKYRKARANRFGFKSVKLFEEHIENLKLNQTSTLDNIMSEEFNLMCKNSLTNLINESSYINEDKLRNALENVYYGKNKDVFSFINGIDEHMGNSNGISSSDCDMLDIELNHIAVSDSNKMSSILMYMIPEKYLELSKFSNTSNTPYFEILNYAYFRFLRKTFINITNKLYAEFGFDYIRDNSDFLVFNKLLNLINNFDFKNKIE
jgi:hypothetical protein